MKAEIEREVQQRVQEEKRRLRQEMERELDTTKAILKSSMSVDGMRSQLVVTKDRGNNKSTPTLKKRNSLNLEEIQQAKEDLKKEGKLLKKEKEELKKEEKELKKEQKMNRLSLKKKNREEALAQSRLSWGNKSGKENLAQSMGIPKGSPSAPSVLRAKDDTFTSGSEDDDIPPWKPAAANGTNGVNTPKIVIDDADGGKKEPTKKEPKKESKEERKKREKEEKKVKERQKKEKKEKERQKKEKKDKEKQEKLLRAQAKKQKLLDERHAKKKQETAAKAAHDHKDNNNNVDWLKKKTHPPRGRRDKKDKDSAIPITSSGLLYG